MQYNLTSSDKKSSTLTSIFYVDLWHFLYHKSQHIVGNIILIPDKDVKEPPTLALLYVIPEI